MGMRQAKPYTTLHKRGSGTENWYCHVRRGGGGGGGGGELGFNSPALSFLSNLLLVPTL